MDDWSTDFPADVATYETLRERGQVAWNVEFEYVGPFYLSGLPYYSNKKRTRRRRAKWLAARMAKDIIEDHGGTPSNSGGDADTAAADLYEVLMEGGKQITDLAYAVDGAFSF